ncbi:probable cytochrome P450 301a1, mitochondrial [Agrilus planipennis]|uniref:Probable cytochrome P450 301a1, mitochondrial n=1 Tax=Agrilus planipennis TaxID=224129 RepID=A0A1W4WQN2_AGRPL|nr:probable cytochrome P450 301a1, mitochondrial [Agrilus planipennis]
MYRFNSLARINLNGIFSKKTLFLRNLADVNPKTADYPLPGEKETDSHAPSSYEIVTPTSKSFATSDDVQKVVFDQSHTTAIFDVSTKEKVVQQAPLPFDDVPGPRSLYAFAKVWGLLPIVGTQLAGTMFQYVLNAREQVTWGSPTWLFHFFMNEYGPVVRLSGPLGGDVVILCRPELASAIFENEGPYPVRSCFDCIEKYRLQYRKYRQAGPFLMYGQEWEKLRSSIETSLAHSSTAQFSRLEKISEEFAQRIGRIRNKQEEVPSNFLQEINKWAVECLWTVMTNKPMGFLDPSGLSTMSEPSRLLESLIGATEGIRKCESGMHFWKLIETPAWRNLSKHCDSIDSIVNKYIRKAQATLRERKEKDPNSIVPSDVSLMEGLLIKDGMLPEDVMTVMLDMLLIGVNTTSHAVGFLMYHLARFPRAQNILYEEVKKSVSSDGSITKSAFDKMVYLKACIKESLRLKPPMPLLTRILNKDVVVNNYKIPRGTYVLIASHLAGLKEEYFDDADRFRPERWLDPSIDRSVSTLATIPYGFGPKACLARELAEIEVGLLVSKVLQKFKIHYYYGDILSTNKFISFPTRPLKFRFIDRKD